MILPVDRLVIDGAVEVKQRHRLRGYDALHLASAGVTGETLQSHHLPAPVFVAADKDLLTAAVAERLPTENPMDHTALDANNFSSQRDPEHSASQMLHRYSTPTPFSRGQV